MMDKHYLMNAISWSEGQLESLMDPNSCSSMDHLESALSSMVSSQSPGLSNDAVALRELLIGGSSFPPPSPYSNLSSPLNNKVNLGNSVPSLSGDPGFAERAAKFSCFGSRSFNGRTLLNNGGSGSPLKKQQKIPRVSSTPCIVEINKYSKGASSNEEESSVSEQIPSSNSSRKRKVAVSKGKQSKGDGSNELVVKDGNGKRCKPTERRDNEEEEEETKGGGSSSSNDNDESEIQKQQPLPIEKDYIHVRARRGQATDSHSLAERVRREKISERMKLLQDLVPGCNKVTGKALMLDEIINYVQSLQRQVEFLSMKLATVNPELDSSNMDNLLPKDLMMGPFFDIQMFQQNPNLPHQMYHLDSSSPVFYNHQNPVDPQQLEARNLGLQLPSLDGLNQFPTFGEDDLHSIVNQMAFGQHPVPHQACNMKVER